MFVDNIANQLPMLCFKIVGCINNGCWNNGTCQMHYL